MKKAIHSPKGVEIVDFTSEEIAQHEKDVKKSQEEEIALEKKRTEKANLKASAKAKLIAGEPLTEAEADTIVL